MARRHHTAPGRGPVAPDRTTRALTRRAFSCPKGAAWLQVLLTLAFVLLGCTSEPEQVSGRVDLLDVSHAALATGTLRFVNGTYGPACKGRSGGFSVALGTTATSMDYPELSVLRGDAACTLTLTSVVGAEAFTAQPPMALTGAFAPAGTTFVGSTGGSSVAFFANSRITPSTFTSDFVIDLLVSDDPKATSAGNAAGSYTGPSSSKSSVSLSRASEVADGFSPILATVTIKNYSGKALPGLSVNLVHSGLASVSPANVTTDTNGVATFQLTSNVITQGELTAKVTGVFVSARPTVIFTRLPMVGGTVAGLSGAGLTLRLTSSSGVATLTPGNGAFAFPPVLKGAWSMAITAQPTLPKQTCSLANGAGVVDYTDVSNVRVTCLSAIPAVGASGTLVGTLTGGQSYSDGTGTAAAFNFPSAVAFDSAGTAYVADQWNNTIRKVTASGAVTTLAGTTTPGYRDGSGEVALFDNPAGIAVDGAGIVYVAEQGSGNTRIRKIDPAGNVTTYAGNGTAGFADGAAATARFYCPTQLALDSSGNLYVADRCNHRIRRISPSGTVTTVAGSGVAGYADGSGAAAQFNQPIGVASDAAGNLVVVDLGNRRVRRVTSSGIVTTLAGSGLSGSADGLGTVATFYSPLSVALDGSGNALVVDASTHNIRRVTPAGVVTTVAGGSGASALDGAALAARFYGPRGIAVDSSGTVLVADSGNSLIRRLASGQVSTLAGAFGVGYADGDARVARFNKPVGIVAHSSGHYVIDSNNQVIRNVARSGLVTTLAGRPGVLGGSDGAAAVATFNYPFMGTLEANGNLLVADTYNYRLRRVTPTGNVTTIGTLGWISSSLDGSEATARFDGPIALATAPDGTVYVSERGTSHRLRRLATGNVTTLAGRLQYLDGTGLNARFNTPYSVAVDLSGNVYMADRNNHRIRKMSAAGEVTTVAGTGVPGFADGPAGTAMFKFPTGIDVDTSGNLYVADSENNRIRVVSTSGVVSTLAGSTLGSLDGAGSTARFYSPWGVAVDGSGSVVVADRSNHRIRRVSPAGVVSTVAGASAGYVDGLAASARFNDPRGVAVDSAGNVYVADNGNRRVRRISPTGDVTTIAGSSLTIDINGPADTSGFTGFPGGIRVDSQGAVYVVAGWSLRRIASGMVTSFAGSVSSDGTVDGAGASARFYSPSGLALDAGGNLFMTDGGAIRRVSASGQVTTVAGAAAVGSQDGPATDARFYNPAGLACDESGNVYVADSSNNRIRKVAPDGTTSTLAGSSSGFVDGAGSAARFNGPMGVTYDGAGSLYVADLNNHAIRRVVIASGAVTTVAGASGGYVDGVGSVARFNGPYAVAMAGPGTLVVTDTGNNRLRTITSAAPGQLGVQWGPSFDATGAPLQRFVATATATGRPSASCTVTDGSRSCFISGLVSGVSYSVLVAGYDTNGNETPASQATTGTPP